MPIGAHTKSHHSNPPTYRNFSTSKWHNIPALVEHWWTRADQFQEWHQIPSFVEDDWSSTSSWSSGVQTEMVNLETNGPTWSRSPTSRTRGWGLNGSDIPRKEKSVPAFQAADMPLRLCCPLVCFFCSFLFFSFPFLSFPFCMHLHAIFPQSIWLMLTLPITYELPQIDPAPGTNPCGKIATTIDDVNTAIHGMTYHQYVNLGEFSLSSTWKRCVHSWQQFMMTPWIQQHANPYLLLVEWKNLLCSPIRPDPSISRENTHGEHPAVLHQPTHHVHLGSLSWTHVHGSSLAR